MSGSIPPKNKRERGAALVEFVLVVPLLLLLLFGIIEFALLMYNKHIITNASREGARFGIVVTEGARRSEGAIKTELMNEWIQKFLITFRTDTFSADSIKVCSLEEGSSIWTCPNNTASNFGDRIRVSIKYDYGFLLVPAFVISMTDTISIEAETVMNYE